MGQIEEAWLKGGARLHTLLIKNAKTFHSDSERAAKCSTVFRKLPLFSDDVTQSWNLSGKEVGGAKQVPPTKLDSVMLSAG